MQEIILNGLNEKILYDTCDNGLPVYMWINDKVNSFYMTLSVKYGSIDTEFKLKKNGKVIKVPDGIAHFMEHVKFNEKGGKTANDFFDKIGSDINAFTTFEYTSYEVYATEHFKDNLNHLLDFVMTPVFPKNMVNKERGIIIEEAKADLDNPYNKLYFGMYQNLFHNYKYKNKIVGTIPDIKNITKEDLELIFDTFYHPENMYLVIAGNFNPYEAMQIVKDNQKKKEFKKFVKPIISEEKEKPTVVKKEEITYFNVEIPKVKICYKIPRKSFTEKNIIKLRILLSIILSANFGVTSEFREELFENDLVSNFNVSRDTIKDYVIITANIESKYPDEVIKKVEEKFNKLVCDEKTFERKIKSSIANLVTNFESIGNVNSNIQDHLNLYGTIPNDLKDIYTSIKYNDIKKALKELKLNNQSKIIMLPDKKDEK